MTLSKDQPPRRRIKPEPKYPWLVPLFVIVAVVVLVGAIIVGIALGVRFF